MTVTPDATIRVATISYLAGERLDLLGDPLRIEPTDQLVRDARVAHLRNAAVQSLG